MLDENFNAIEEFFPVESSNYVRLPAEAPAWNRVEQTPFWEAFSSCLIHIQIQESVSAGVGQPLNLCPACIAKLFKFSCFGAGCAGTNSGRLLGIFPILEFSCVYW